MDDVAYCSCCISVVQCVELPIGIQINFSDESFFKTKPPLVPYVLSTILFLTSIDSILRSFEELIPIFFAASQNCIKQNKTSPTSSSISWRFSSHSWRDFFVMSSFSYNPIRSFFRILFFIVFKRLFYFFSIFFINKKNY